MTEHLTADDLVATPTERETLERVRELTGERNGPMERHGVRCFLICEKLAADASLAVDREVLLVAGLLHDMGLYDGASSGGVYVTDGRRYAESWLGGEAGWDPERIRLCGDAIERHHEVRSQWDAGDEVELMRRADMVELTAGLVNYGAGMGWVRGLWQAVPRDGIYGEIGKMVGKAVRERPATIPRILLRGREPGAVETAQS